MKRILENNTLKVSIQDLGGELSSIYDKEKKQEVLWQADPAYWKRHAPILFPNVGKHYGNHYSHKGIQYPSSQHGFARDSQFTCTQESPLSVTHTLTSSGETMKIYPFPFLLQVTHTLKDNQLEISWHVENTGEETMYFTIGGHPAFRVPVLPDTTQPDYYLLFRKDALSYYLLDPASGTARTEQAYALPLENGRCSIQKGMFDKDALIFDHQISWAAIGYPDGKPYISVSCEGFPNFGIWAAPGAPFVCLEPWDGRCDNYGFQEDISLKPGILSLKPGQHYRKSYTITIH